MTAPTQTSPPQPCSVEVRGGGNPSSPAPSGAVPSDPGYRLGIARDRHRRPYAVVRLVVGELSPETSAALEALRRRRAG